jgi:hypothetical protein
MFACVRVPADVVCRTQSPLLCWLAHKPLTPRPPPPPPPHTHTRTHIVVLQDLHVQLRSKNDMMKAMKRQIKKLNGTLPKMLEEQPDDDDWAW